MLDDARSIWELIERRVAATPDRVMLYDGDRATTFAQYRDLAERAAAGLLGARRRARRERVVAAPDVDGVGGARRRAVPARRDPEPDAADLPGARDLVHRRSRRTASCSSRRRCGTTSTTPRSPSRSRARTTTCTRSSPITGTPTATRRRCRPPPAVFDDPARRPGALDLLHVGHDRGAEGRAAHRSLGARRRDRLRGEDPRGRRRHRARRVPVHARRRHHHRRVHAAAHRFGRGADGSVDAARRRPS